MKLTNDILYWYMKWNSRKQKMATFSQLVSEQVTNMIINLSWSNEDWEEITIL